LTADLDAARVREALAGRLVGREVVVLPEVDSTNSYAKAAGLPEGAVVAALAQTAGRGRLGRGWYSPPGEALYVSVVLRPPGAPHTVTLAAGLAACQGLDPWVPGLGLKWPNDLVVNGKKLAGILTEGCGGQGTGPFIVTGFGVNVNNPGFPPGLGARATSLLLETGRPAEREAVLVSLLRALDGVYGEFCAGGFAPLRPRYLARCVTLGRRVRLWRAGAEEEALALDVTDQGELLVQDPQGRRQTVCAGEVSIKAN
jgi:BirA family biotin operon repressor/biotin-[acetyl-CoA-carboxylase] ligase